MSFIEQSERLHGRVRDFARTALAGAPAESFDDLARDIARFQAAHVPGFRRLVEARGSSLSDAASIPAVPVDAFRLSRVAAHPPELDEVRFVTSGTTGGAPGVHAMRTTRTYRELSLAWGAPALIAARPGPRVVVALAPDPGTVIASSLAFMMRALMETLDGRALAGTHAGGFESDIGRRWLVTGAGVDVAGLERAASIARERREPLLVLATSFALVLLADVYRGCFNVPEGSVVMTTGGYKGRTREVAPAELARRAAEMFGIGRDAVVGEYGMTELTSQLYEGASSVGESRVEAGFRAPPWLRVTAVDAETLSPVGKGETGIARFVDLGNVDSAVAIVTQDLVRVVKDRVVLHGRRAGAPARGCSLAVEEMVLGGSGP